MNSVEHMSKQVIQCLLLYFCLLVQIARSTCSDLFLRFGLELQTYIHPTLSLRILFGKDIEASLKAVFKNIHVVCQTEQDALVYMYTKTFYSVSLRKHQ